MRTYRARGFTLVELVVVLSIIAVLAAIALPRFVALGRDARLAAVRTMATTLQSTALSVRVACKTNPACDYDNPEQFLTIAGRPAWVNFGWLNSGDNLNDNQIDAWVVHDGFSVSLAAGNQTIFAVDDAPDAANCSATYWDSWVAGHANTAIITTATSGC